MSALRVIFVSEGNCQNCNGVRAVLAKVRHEYRHVEVLEVRPDEPLGRSLAGEHGIRALPALIVDGHLRLAGEIPEKLVRREIEKARPRKALVSIVRRRS